MKNKNLQQTQIGLIDKLLGVVNSKEEFNYLLAERKNLSVLSSNRIRRRYA